MASRMAKTTGNWIHQSTCACANQVRNDQRQIGNGRERSPLQVRLPKVTVDSTTRAPPSLLSVATTSSFLLSTYTCAPRLRARFSLSLAGDRDRIKTHARRKLHAEMAEPANTQNRDDIARHGAALAQRVVGGDARAEQRCGIGRREIVRDHGEALGRRHHRFGIAAIIGDAGNAQIAAIDQPAAAARFAAAANEVNTLLEAWAKDANWMKRQPGFISTQLHRAIGDSHLFLNYAVWELAHSLPPGFHASGIPE